MKKTFIYTILFLLVATLGFSQDAQVIDQGTNDGFKFDLVNMLIGLAVGAVGGFLVGKSSAKKV
jgi:hypothetical protein